MPQYGVPRTLAPLTIDVWYRATEALDDAETAQQLIDLSAAELARHERFVFARDRRDFAAAHALLRRALSRYADVAPRAWEFVEEPGGKPGLAAIAGAPALSFNLSHTHGLVACAIAGGPRIGVDVESVERVVDDSVAERFFSDEENRALRRCGTPLDQARRFFALWTLKEAYIKAIGQGLSHPLNTIVFEIQADGAVAFTPPARVAAESWQFALFAPTDRHCLAIAAQRDDADSEIRLLAG